MTTDPTARTLVCSEFTALSLDDMERRGLPYVDGSTFVDSFLHAYLSVGTFSRLALVDRGNAGLARRARALGQRCWVVAALEPAVKMSSELRRRCMHGFEALFVVSESRADELTTFMRGQYELAGRSVVGSGEPHDALVAAWNRSELERCLEALGIQRQEGVWLFAHDADPAYLIEAEDARRD